MKKLLGILVLGLLWCNASLANNKLPGSIFNLNDCRTSDGILTDYKINTENNTLTVSGTNNHGIRFNITTPIKTIETKYGEITSESFTLIRMTDERQLNKWEVMALRNTNSHIVVNYKQKILKAFFEDLNPVSSPKIE